MSPALPDRRPVPLYLDRTLAGVLELGKAMGAPDMSWRADLDGVCTVTYHWAHGDRVIYPQQENDMVNPGPTKPYTPKPGDIGLTTIDGWGGKGIQAAQRLMGCPWDAKQHAFGVVSINTANGEPWIVEAMPEGARHVLNWHKPENTVYLRCPDMQRDEVAAAYLSLVRTPYSWLDYQAIALHHLHVPAPWLKNYIMSTKHMICSQLVDEGALRGGWHLFDDGRWPGYVPPCDLWRLYRQEYPS